MPHQCAVLGVVDIRRSSESEVLPRLARPTLGRRLQIQPQVSRALLDHQPLQFSTFSWIDGSFD